MPHHEPVDSTQGPLERTTGPSPEQAEFSGEGFSFPENFKRTEGLHLKDQVTAVGDL